MIPKIEVYQEINEKEIYKGQISITSDITKLLYISEVMGGIEFENFRKDLNVCMCPDCYHKNKSPNDCLLDYLEEYFAQLILKKYETCCIQVQFELSSDEDKKEGIHAKVTYTQDHSDTE
jgi:hypothetical protein